MVVIELSKMEFESACFVGLQRTSARLFGGSRHVYGADSTRLFDTNMMGCLAEYAVAKFLGCNWSDQPENMRIPDVGGIIEVRSTPHVEGVLRIHEGDKDGAPYVLALTHDLPYVQLVGWCFGSEGKQKEFYGDKWGNNRPAYWVPQDRLGDMAQLKARYEEWRQKKGA